MSEKQEIRNSVLEELHKIDRHLHRTRSLHLVGQLFATEEWKEAQTIATTLARHPEIATEAIILKALQEGKQIVLPRTYNATKEMIFKKYSENDALEKKKLSLLEPLETAETVSPTDIDLVVVPGVVFNAENYRIGFGGGFYDRFLADYQGISISLCLDEQYHSFQPEAHDIPVTFLIRENQ